MHCKFTVVLQCTHCKKLHELYSALHCKFTVGGSLFSALPLYKPHPVQGYTVFKFYPLSLRYRDPAASPLNARQYMFENQAIKLINRQLS